MPKKEKGIRRLLVASLLGVILLSCTVQKPLRFVEDITLNPTENKLSTSKQTILKLSPSVLKLGSKNLEHQDARLTPETRGYVAAILRETKSLSDSLVGVSWDFIVLRSASKSKIIDADYRYHYDFDIGRWVRSYVDASRGETPPDTGAYSFFRKLYISKRRNRVIVKDCFGDLTCIYVVQGQDDKSPYRHTSVWRPSEHQLLIITADYIKAQIDPISYDIAKSRALLLP